MDIMKYLLVETVPAIVKEEKPKPVKIKSLGKTVAGIGGGLAASSSRFGFGKQINALHQGTKAKVLPKLLGKMGKFGTSKLGGALAKGGAWTAGAGLAYGLADALAFGGGSMVGSGIAGAASKIRNKFKRPGASIGQSK